MAKRASAALNTSSFEVLNYEGNGFGGKTTKPAWIPSSVQSLVCFGMKTM